MLGILETKKEKNKGRGLGDLCTLGGGVVDFRDKGTFEQIVEGAK